MEKIQSYNKNFILKNPNIKSNVQLKAPKTIVVRKEKIGTPYTYTQLGKELVKILDKVGSDKE